MERCLENWNACLIFLMGAIIFALTLGIINGFENWNVEVGLSQESADLVCQKITNNTNAIAIDWNYYESKKPRDSLICEINQERIGSGLIQILEE